MRKTVKYTILLISLIFLIIGKVLAAEEQAIDSTVLQDIRPPVNLPFNIGPIIILLIVLGFLVLAWIVWNLLKRKKSNTQIIAPPKSPSEIAYGRLEILLKKNLPQQRLIKEYFIEISDIMRRYVEGRFTVRAPELTTPEFLERIKRSDQLKLDHKQLLKEFLNCCDLVKFAKYGPSEKEINESATLVRRFVDDTKQTATVEEEVQNAI